uniref:Uncharacterized protein n=1 Tax=Quercus lobata TaxID=97700 RepID=A0A7N2LLI7_QUELO
MHGRGSQAGAPASDAAGRGDAGGTPQTARPSRVVPRRATWRIPTRADAAKIGADAAEIGADAAQIGPTRSVSAVSANIGRPPIRPKHAGIGRNRPKQTGIGRNRPKQAGIGRNRPKQAEIGRENRRRGRNSDLRCVSCLILSLFCESTFVGQLLRIER